MQVQEGKLWPFLEFQLLAFLRLSETDAEGKRRQSKIYGSLRGQIMGIFGISTFCVFDELLVRLSRLDPKKVVFHRLKLRKDQFHLLLARLCVSTYFLPLFLLIDLKFRRSKDNANSSDIQLFLSFLLCCDFRFSSLNIFYVFDFRVFSLSIINRYYLLF